MDMELLNAVEIMEMLILKQKTAEVLLGFSSENGLTDYSIKYCFNAGEIRAEYNCGGICGAAWPNSDEWNKLEGKNVRGVAIGYSYNLGKVTVTQGGNGGILAATYYNVTGGKVKLDNANIIEYCYNLGNIYHLTRGETSQIADIYISGRKNYYPAGRVNYNNFAEAKDIRLFSSSDPDSVLFLLNEERPGTWILKDGKIILSWQENIN